MQKKKFVYQIEIEGIPYNEKTATDVYGEGAFFPDWPEDSFVREKVYELFQDALTQRLWFKMREVTKPVQDVERHEAYLRSVDRSIEINEKMKNSLTFLRVEDLTKE
jgi:hypothetical protein